MTNKQLLVIPIQSISDIITNSSSEVFILEADKTCENINTVLHTFTSGFRYPEVFSLKDFREWREKLRNGEVEDDWSYPGTMFSIAKGWFKDPEDEEDCLDLRRDFLFDPYEILYHNGKCVGHSFNPSFIEPIHVEFLDYLNSNWDSVKDLINGVLESEDEKPVVSIEWKTLRRYHYWMKEALSDVTDTFLKTYKGPKPTVWDVSKYEDVRSLDGKVLVVGEYDNSIPYDTWDEIKDLFNGWNIHLG